ncbi:polyprenyl synthetase family protein [Vagococcus coleopterorum]|uniref:Farnesyl diphosphate synthase n=1 Tax=Vagococcus coleopterorum TaxID=2714946 RepID=A0A6G8AKJ6_9ENTE|nr:farnesyl diphosphate synthase [Vagococcus coleopterorum]QIL45591.1 polyprenyl synthetase family protein [Vagococcus coleopterorum]
MTDVLKQFAQEHVEKINQEMATAIQAHTTEKSLLESMSYSVEAGGKRLRPLLLLATQEFLGKPLTKGSYQVAAALEMIHTYSLIHDDLPAMDNDELRRGKPTNHMVYGEGLAILAGDALLTEAFHVVGEGELSDEQKVWTLTNLAKASGSYGMIAGQVADIEGETKSLTLSELQRVHARKTGALIEFAVAAGAMLADATSEVMAALAEYSHHFGIAFQIKDDLLDVIGDEAVIGKKTGMDAELNKTTYTSLLGVAGAQQSLKEHYEEAIAIIERVEKLTNRENAGAVLKAMIQTLID